MKCKIDTEDMNNQRLSGSTNRAKEEEQIQFYSYDSVLGTKTKHGHYRNKVGIFVV